MRAGLGDLIICLAMWLTPILAVGLLWLNDRRQARAEAPHHSEG